MLVFLFQRGWGVRRITDLGWHLFDVSVNTSRRTTLDRSSSRLTGVGDSHVRIVVFSKPHKITVCIKTLLLEFLYWMVIKKKRI